MSTGGRGVVFGFGLAVAAALGAVAWLVLSGSPPVDVGQGGRTIVPPSPRPKEDPPRDAPPLPPAHKRERPPREPRTTEALEIQGVVQDAEGAPVEGASVVVYRKPLVEASAPAAPSGSGAGPGTGERVDGALLEDLFVLEPEEVERAAPWSGVPALPAASSLVEEARGRSGADGTFRIRVGRNAAFRVEATLEGKGSAVADEAMPRGPAVVLRLGPAASLEGRVVRLLGSEPVEGAVVVARSGSVEKGITAGPGGAFRIEGLPPGKYSLTAGAAGLAPTTVNGIEVPSSSGPVEIGLGSGFTLRVTVLKWEDLPKDWRRGPGNTLPPGPPIAGARVVLYRNISDAYVTGLTGSDGTVRFERLGEGFWRVGAWKEGFGVGSGGRDVRLKNGGPVEESREVRLEAAVPTPVRVMDEGGAPIVNAKVYFGGRDEEFDERRSRLVGRTDAQGALDVTFDGNVPAKSVVWIVPEDGRAVAMVEPEDFGPGAEAKAVVRPGRVVEGTVTDDAGRPVKGAELTLSVADDERDLDLTLYAYTDAEGKYRFPPVPFGETALDVDWEDDWESVDFDADDRRAPLVQDFTLEAPEKDE